MTGQVTPRDPEELEAAGAPASAELPASTTVGAVHLTVADLDRSIDYYVRAVGLEILDRAASSFLPSARVTSECNSPILRRLIALGFAAQSLSDGSLVRLPDGRLARTARLPFYDAARRLPRGAPL